MSARRCADPCLSPRSATGPSLTFGACFANSGAAKSHPGRRQRFSVAVCASLRLPCGARPCGPSHNSLRSLAFATLRQGATSQSTRRAARAGHKACAPRRPAGALPPARARLCGNSRGGLRLEDQLRWPSRQVVPSRGDLWGGEEHRSGVGAHSAQRRLTRRTCSSAVSAANAASCAARPQAEHRSAVGAQRRPPHHESLPGAACRDAQTLQLKGTLSNNHIEPKAAAPAAGRFTCCAFCEVRRGN